MTSARKTALRLLVALVFVGTLVAGVALLHQRSSASSTPDAPIPLTVESIIMEQSGGYEVTDRFIGRLEPARRAAMSFERQGLITGINVDEGHDVEKGGLIGTLDTALLMAERDRLEGRRLQVSSSLELARLTESRQRRLQRDGHVSEQRLDEARLATASTQGELAALQAELKRVAIDIEKSEIRAPFAGRIARRLHDEGEVVAAGTPIVDLLETGRPQARIGVPPAIARAVPKGSAQRVYISGQPFTGTVAAVRPDMATGTRTVAILIDLDKGVRAAFGEIVELRVARFVPSPGYWVPVSALTESVRGLWSVLTLQTDADTDTGNSYRVGQEIVEVLHSTGERAFVRGTLQTGQRIVASGRNRVIPNQNVILLSAASAPVP